MSGGIPEHSESYPYLALAKRRGLDYGAVLTYADWLDHVNHQMTQNEFNLCRTLSDGSRREIRKEYDLEMQRRERRSS